MGLGLEVRRLAVPGDALLLVLERREDRRAHLVRVGVGFRVRDRVRDSVRG